MTVTTDRPATIGDELLALGREVNANQYRLVHLAARYDDGLEWFHQGHKSAAAWISRQLGIHTATAREWIRIGHALRDLPSIDAAFANNQISYAKVRILTRWADPDTELEMLDLAGERSADRLTTAVAQLLADGDESDDERDARLYEFRSVTSWTDGDGMTIIRVALPPDIGKPVLAAVDEMVRRIAETPATEKADSAAEPDRTPATPDASADAFVRRCVTDKLTHRPQDAPADAFPRQRVTTKATRGEQPPLVATLHELRRRWQPAADDDWSIPSLAQQRADAFTALFLGLDVDLTTEVVIHVRGDGVTFGDGTPTTDSGVLRALPDAFIRLLLHDAERRPVNASSRRRFPTTAQRRVVMETHGHECVDCQSTDLLELDHNPPFHLTGHTVAAELEPRCAPCHRSRHRRERRHTTLVAS